MFWEQVCASLRLLLFFNTSPLTVGFFLHFFLLPFCLFIRRVSLACSAPSFIEEIGKGLLLSQ